MSEWARMNQTWEDCEAAMGSDETEAMLARMDQIALEIREHKNFDVLYQHPIEQAEYIAGVIIDKLFITSGNYPGAIHYDGTMEGLIQKLETWKESNL